ncbi:inositol oxygenase [Synchytrium microbalum]|uniref:Inositol oxygenase n=1 Tax=Synchytrium microbalum TaxID=1806994 RepID=A0A507C810_9FUNG|nr:inositol oxygenase [Synchytrium microbalum]TPX33635.1 inositol oxygenase [Synchytrium microbalum]
MVAKEEIQVWDYWEQDLVSRYPEPVENDTKSIEIHDEAAFRDYLSAPDTVRQFYAINHREQCVKLIKAKRQKYYEKNIAYCGVWQMLEKLDSLVDESDPDTSLSQMQHALQSAEAARRDGRPDWFQLVCLIHDLGKILFFEGEPQHLVVGDTFPVGLPFSAKIVHPEYFRDNPDIHIPEYQTKYGIYEPGCGLDNVLMSFGMSKVCESYLPKPALSCIRYHSFYSWHRDNQYRDLMCPEDEEKLKWVREFNPYDLYSKHNEQVDVEQVAPYYKGIIAKYFPEKIRW